MAKIANFTAYRIDGDYYLRRGKYSGKKKERLIWEIQKGEHVPTGFQEDFQNKERRKTNKTGYCDSFKDDKIQEKEVKKWQQLTLEL